MTTIIPLLLALSISAEPSSTSGESADFHFDPTAIISTSSIGLMEDLPSHATSAFAIAGSTYWTLNAGGGSDFAEDDLAKFGVGISHFLADDFSIDLELNILHFWQDSGRDATGANVSLLFRWHFLHDDSRSWTVYVDGGAGMLVTTDDVPSHGSSFNFTPQAGFGVSFDLGNDLRLYVGGRWYHVSNARLYDSNPGRDYGMVYVMLSWPF